MTPVAATASTAFTRKQREHRSQSWLPDRTFADIVFFFFFFLFLSFLFFFSLFFVYLFFFSFCYNFNPLILPGNDDGFFFFSRGIFLFSCIVVEVWSRSCWDSSRTGKRIVFSLMNETKEKKREKYAEWCDFFTWCVSSCVAMNTRVDLTWSTLRLKFKSEDFEFSYLCNYLFFSIDNSSFRFLM